MRTAYSACLTLALIAGCTANKTETDIDRLVTQAVATQPSSPSAAMDMLVRTTHAIDLAETTIAENLANAKVTAYRARRVSFGDGGRVSIYIETECGAMESTCRQLDIAIQGSGFIPVRFNGKTVYTRCGSMFRNCDGDLIVNVGEGVQLVPPINIPPNVPEENVSIGSDGKVEYIMPGSNTKTQAGQLHLAYIVAPQYLTPVTAVCFATNDLTGEATVGNPGENGTGTVLSGFLEASNVIIPAEEVRQLSLKRWRAAIDRAIARADRR